MRFKKVVALFAVAICNFGIYENGLAQQCTGPDVKASDLINARPKLPVTGPKHVVVRAPKVLVFDKSDPKIYLQGWVSEITADCVRVNGTVKVESYMEDLQSSSGLPGSAGGKGAPGPSSPACGDNGCKGEKGVTGSDGTRGTPGYRPIALRLTLGKVVWNGTLQIANSGAMGGNGGAGGRGGPGGDGGKGRDRTCEDSPGNGGLPGDGGFGGNGGAGAIGGAGGSISYNSGLSDALRGGQLVLEAPGGKPGKPGPGAFGGPCGTPGQGGNGGSGWCGGGGSPGLNICVDRTKSQSGLGAMEEKGADGYIYCRDCSE